jgi:DNA-binding SARP family transcriptional activator
MAQDMEFRLLGPLLVYRGETPVPLSRGHQRAVLAAL